MVVSFADELHKRNVWMGFGGDRSWYVYESGYWRRMSTEDDVRLGRILERVCRDLGLVYSEKRKVVWNRLETAIEFDLDIQDFDQQPRIAMLNGTLDVETGELHGHKLDDMTTRTAEVEWVPDAKCPEWIKIINDVFSDRDPKTREQIVGLIQEWMGVAVAGGANERTPRALRKAMFLYGPENCGKSSILKVIDRLFGSTRVVTSRVSDLTTTHGLQAFLDAKAWITEEVEGLGKLSDSARVKCLITGEPLNVPRKYMTDTTLKFNGPVAWAGNARPNFPESSGALYDRVIVIECERQFTAAEAKKKFGQLKPIEWLDAKGEMPGVFAWAIEGYRRLLARGFYEKIEDLEQAGQSWRESNDAAFAFLKECCDSDEGTVNAASTLAWAALAHAKSTRNEFVKLRAIQMDLRNAMPSVYPNVKHERLRRDDGRRAVYVGLKLNKMGLAYLKQAQLDNEASSNTPTPNEKLLGSDG